MYKLNSQKGSALLVTLFIMLILYIAISFSMDSSITENELSFNQLHSDQAFYIALAGIERVESQLETDLNWRTGFTNESFEDGVFTAVVIDSTSEPSLMDTILVRVIGEEHESRAIIEALYLDEKYHPLYNHAIYAGNFDEYDPLADTQSYTANINFGGTGSERDIINGDVYFNGHMNINDGAELNGNAYAGGTYSGNSPSGSTTETADYLEPPDLKAQNYESTSDYVINSSSGWNGSGYLPSNDPRHIFVKDFRTDLAASHGYSFDNPNFFFGDPYEGSNINRISVSDDGNKKTYFVDGNLWIEPMGRIAELVNGPDDGTQITIVVKGNIYFSDDLVYEDNQKDGLAFIAMTDGESFTDQNGNSTYDPGEPILHDDGDNVYEGPSEGSGNIQFGDPNGGPLGDISGYLYAENNFEDYVLDGPNGDPQNFGVNGMLSAGNQFNVNRDFGGGHSKMTVDYDDRLQKGQLDLPGLPKRNITKSEGLVQVAWKEL